MLRKISLAILAIFALVLAAMPAEAMSITSIGTPIYLSRDNETATSGNVKFVTNDGVLKLWTKDGQTDILSFINCDGIKGQGVDYKIRDVYTSNPAMHLWEITATVGPMEKNCGYWLVGLAPTGHYAAFVTHFSFQNLGYTIKDWHKIRSELVNGLLLVTSSHTYMPRGARSEYEALSRDDFRVQIFWDDNSNWFGLRKIF